jgi:hypothetical protein
MPNFFAVVCMGTPLLQRERGGTIVAVSAEPGGGEVRPNLGEIKERLQKSQT